MIRSFLTVQEVTDGEITQFRITTEFGYSRNKNFNKKRWLKISRGRYVKSTSRF